MTISHTSKRDGYHIMGGCHFDERLIVKALVDGQSVPAKQKRQLGGVAFNAAQVLKAENTDIQTHFFCGDDLDGKAIALRLSELGFEPPCRRKGATPRYTVVENQQGQVLFGLADMELYARVETLPEALNGRAINLIVDSNLPTRFFQNLKNTPLKSLHVLATSPAKTQNFKSIAAEISTLFLNLDEARALAGQAHASIEKVAEGLVNLGFRRFLITQGAKPVFIFENMNCLYIPITNALPQKTSQTGASHTGLGDRLAGLVLANLDAGDCFETATRKAMDKPIC